MGPLDSLPLVPGVDAAPDHAARAQAFQRRFPDVVIAVSEDGWTATWSRSAGTLGLLMDALESGCAR